MCIYPNELPICSLVSGHIEPHFLHICNVVKGNQFMNKKILHFLNIYNFDPLIHLILTI